MAFLMEDRDGTQVVVVSGDIDLTNRDEVMDAAGGLDPCVLDLSAVTSLDSSTLAGLVRLAERGPVRLVAPSAVVASLLRRTSTAQMFDLD